MAITNTFDLLVVNGVKGWIRDSWARRAIASLRQTVAAIVVPTASDATPAMDSTGAAGSSDDYARADHVHPSDTTKQDALTSAQLAACNSGVTADFVSNKFAVVTGTFGSTNGSVAVSYPTGFTVDNTFIVSMMVEVSSVYRYVGDGAGAASARTFARIESASLYGYNNASALYSANFKILLMRTDI